MTTPTPNPKCTRCKCYWVPDETDIKSSGLYCKSCKKCRGIVQKSSDKCKCEHNKVKSQCKECRGASICEHNRQKSQCKECKGASICEHNKIKSRCKKCGGASICEHNRQKSQCKKCGGASICEHNRIKSTCKDCNFKLYLVNLQRGHLRQLFKLTKEQQKTKPSIEYLGCSAEYFQEYIEKQFKDGMNWDNIHLDHIKPVSKFNLDDEDEFLDCCNYKNFQPLLAKDNLEKSNKFTEEDEIRWKEIMGK